MAVRVFVSGLAAEPAVLQQVLGTHVVEPGVVNGLTLVEADQGPWSVAILASGYASGLLLTLSPDQAKRLDFVLRSLGQIPHPLPSLSAIGYLGQGKTFMTGTLPEVVSVVSYAIADILTLHGTTEPDAILARLNPILVRAASRRRAVDSPPTALRHSTRPGDATVHALRQPYARFFAIEEYDVSWQRFDGTPSDTVTRAAFLSGDAVTVLPYDAVRDRVLLIEQFRAGPLARGDTQLWQVETIAGRVDPFETPEQAARREAEEEAGLTLTDLHFVARYYPSPGAVSEYLYSYLALTDLPDGIAGVFGVEGEAEDIRGHLISFDALMALVTSGEIENAPLILTAFWLERERSRLRANA